MELSKITITLSIIIFNLIFNIIGRECITVLGVFRTDSFWEGYIGLFICEMGLLLYLMVVILTLKMCFYLMLGMFKSILNLK